MDKREMLKRYVELKVEQPYEGANGLGSAYEKIFDYGKSDMFMQLPKTRVSVA